MHIIRLLEDRQINGTLRKCTCLVRTLRKVYVEEHNRISLERGCICVYQCSEAKSTTVMCYEATTNYEFISKEIRNSYNNSCKWVCQKQYPNLFVDLHSIHMVGSYSKCCVIYNGKCHHELRDVVKSMLSDKQLRQNPLCKAYTRYINRHTKKRLQIFFNN